MPRVLKIRKILENMLFTIVEYLQNIIYNSFAIFSEAHPQETAINVPSNTRDKEMAKFLIENFDKIDKIDHRNLNVGVPISLAFRFMKEAVLESLARKEMKIQGETQCYIMLPGEIT